MLNVALLLDIQKSDKFKKVNMLNHKKKVAQKIVFLKKIGK